ncbi:MAG: methyltransferase domain-containing protein [Rhodospirillales bacterium]|nr:methyltransferase domain-containing protein [Rhodospirillales bacterium]
MTQSAPTQSNEEKAKSIYAQAVECIKKQDFSGAEKYLKESMDIFPTADAAHNLGTLRYMQGNIDTAVNLFQQATILDPHYDAAYANIMKIFYERGDIEKAMEYSAMAITAAPHKRGHKLEFTIMLKKIRFDFFHPEIKRLIGFCLEDETLDLDYIGIAWMSLMISDPELAPIYNLRHCKDFNTFEKKFDNLGDYNTLQSRYLTLGLERITVCDLGFELFLTHLRHLILKDHVEGKSVIFDKNFLTMIASLAIYCFYTEYIFDVSEEEKKWLEILREKVKAQQDFYKDPKPLCLLACYENIYKLPQAKNIADQLANNPELKKFLKYHLRDPLEEMQISKSIVSLTELQTETSAKVQEMYEELPYPRLRYVPDVKDTVDLAPVRDIVPKGKIKILNAGCGTGNETIYFARTFPEAEITAIDLSRTSLAYAIRKTTENHIPHIIYRQADILALDKVFEPSSFDIIVSSGVLHHLKNPEDGLAVLVSLLKPGGVMNLALYSEIGRRSVVKARKAIAQKSIGNDNESVKNFRKNINSLLPKPDIENLQTSRDYYFLSQIKDYLFHVMEHRFTTVQLKELLEKNNLEFMGFKDFTTLETLSGYLKRFPQDPRGVNLENWHRYEMDNPDTFKRMYQFWVRKKP